MLSYKEYLEILEALSNEVFLKDKDIEDLDTKIGRNKNKIRIDLVDMVSKIHDNYMDFYLDVEKKLVKLIKPLIYKDKKAKLFTGLKPFESVIDKSIKRKKGYGELNDLVRGAVLFDTKELADEFVKKLMRKYSDIVVGYEEKTKGKDTEYGYYGSHHLDLNLDGLIVELQVMTRKLWNYKVEGHKIYAKTRSKEGGATEQDKKESKKIFRLANENIEWKEIDLFDDLC